MIRAEPNLGVYASLSELVALQHKARGFSFLPVQPIHSLLAGRHASRLRGRGLDFEELRHYQFGDDVRQIDWKATNRTRKTQVRVYTEERERAVLLVVDQRLKMFFGSQRNMKSVTAAEAAGLAAWRVIFVKDRVGAVVFNDSAIVVIRPRRSRGTVMQILGAVLKQNHALAIDAGIVSQAPMLNEALRRVDRLATHDMLVCLITDGYGADKETERLTTRIARHNDVLVSLIYDPLEAELPVAGPLVFSEGKRQLEVDTRSKRLRTAFRASFDERVQRAHKFLLQREVPLIPISTAEDVAAQLRRLLGQAAPRLTARTKPRPPMVCVKLPRSVLVVFHLIRATELPLFRGLKSLLITFRSRLLLALGCPVCVGQGSLLSAHVCVLTAHDAIYASNPRGTSTPIYQRVLHPRASAGVRRSKVEGF